ncbi:hypothetical protein A3770_19p83770 [Chloropicon primus]|uniref:Uncharacterized protein n=1 Tax=Chloropicon primus TaxID=1764295 RepID=A0A5B8MZE5_9CHLO|nr:hypothetical protein A3770_19p83770 [Chloropicon primus]|eukprot:QDZ25859.1 hypothetical protein A3770_19p83770 [Chloropicon primus]
MASSSPLAEGTKGSSGAEVSETVSKASGFKPTPQESFDVEVRDPAKAAAVTEMAKDPEMLPETVGGDKKPKGKRIGMKVLAWGCYGGSGVPALIFVILCFYTWQEFNQLQDKVKTVQYVPGDLPSNATSGVQNGAVLIDIDGLSNIFQGAAVNGAVVLVAVVIYYVASASLLMCSCVSLAHPTKKLNRGICIGGAFWLMFLTLNSGLQFTSFQSLVTSMSRNYDTEFNTDILASTAAFGYISAISFLLLSMAFFFWKEKVVTVHH